MSCKMVDAMIDANPVPYTWYTLNSPYKVELGPNEHPSSSKHPICRIARQHRLKDVPNLFALTGVLKVIRERAREP